MDLKSFIKGAFAITNPGREFQDNFHIDLITAALTDVENGKIQRLIINIPPRYMKSLIVSAAWPAWLLGNNPTKRIIVASYSQMLANKHSIDSRVIINSEWYEEHFPEVELTKYQNTKYKFLTTKRGFRFATSTRGTLTGEGADYIVVDDPHQPVQALSPKYRNNVIDWYEQILASRLDDKKRGAIIIIMQRLHEEDLCGYLTKKNPKMWKVINLPIIATQDQTFTFNNQTFTRKENTPLMEIRDNLEEIEQIRLEMGDYAFSAQYLQSPINMKGSMLQTSWLHYFSDLHETDDTEFIISCDTAIKSFAYSDYTVLTVWAIQNGNYYLLDVIRDKLEYPALKKLIMLEATKWNPNGILIEDKASGQSLIQDLKSGFPHPVIGITPSQDKATRFASVTTFFESGKVFFKERAKWLIELEKELLSFPNSTNDDQVDSISQFLNYTKNKRKRPEDRMRIL